ncbi:MAG: CDP-diacylglycerol--glycerol-3-phosphate 3-phosphatidyltransferase [Aquificae bacterium]|nr:CDP-diacylglycerol--glycerol-3-phosphate 3-phosphatidyltransferase [Aquificota bacterium]
MQSINFANWLTISRLFLTPVVIFTVLKDLYLLSGLLVAFAVLTDWLDGTVARKKSTVTKHGELLDPAVDKIFTISVLVAFVEKQVVSAFAVFLIVLREIMITWLRSVMVNRGVVLPASTHGKIKTSLQLGAIFLLSLNFIQFGTVLLWLSIAVAYISAFDYFKTYIKERAWE